MSATIRHSDAVLAALPGRESQQSWGLPIIIPAAFGSKRECDPSAVYARWGAPRWPAMPLDIRISFGRAIHRIREEQKINQEEAADRCGLHRTYYSGIERGIRNVSLVNIGKIAKGLKASLSDLFSRV